MKPPHDTGGFQTPYRAHKHGGFRMKNPHDTGGFETRPYIRAHIKGFTGGFETRPYRDHIKGFVDQR